MPDNGFQLSLINSAGLKNVGLVGKIKGMSYFAEELSRGAGDNPGFQAGCGCRSRRLCSGPVLLVAPFMRFPTLVMDSNALPGFTNRRLARFVEKGGVDI